MEAFVAPVTSWEEFSHEAVDFFKVLRSDAGEKLVLEQNLFIEKILPQAMLRQLTEDEVGLAIVSWMRTETR